MSISAFALSYIFRGLIIDVAHRTHNILKTFDQTTFQIAISVLFLYAATAEVANSGKDVHIATTVSQTTSFVIPTISANLTAQSTMNFHQRVNHVSQTKIKTTALVVVIFSIHHHSILSINHDNSSVIEVFDVKKV